MTPTPMSGAHPVALWALAWLAELGERDWEPRPRHDGGPMVLLIDRR